MKRHIHNHVTNSRSLKRGSFLIELSIAVLLLIAISSFLLKGTLDVVVPRNWTIHQNYSDAYLTFEEAYAKRVPFDDIANGTSPWTIVPAAAAVATMGTNTSGTAVNGTIQRILEAGPENGNSATNPAGMETYILYSALTYSIKGTSYVKTRTVVRSR